MFKCTLIKVKFIYIRLATYQIVELFAVSSNGMSDYNDVDTWQLPLPNLSIIKIVVMFKLAHHQGPMFKASLA